MRFAKFVVTIDVDDGTPEDALEELADALDCDGIQDVIHSEVLSLDHAKDLDGMVTIGVGLVEDVNAT